MLWYYLIAACIWLLAFQRFFGEQAVRLLRESWDGIIKADPQGNIRPHGAQELSEELFAMLDDNIPQTQNAPVTFNNTPNADGTPGPASITVNNPDGGHAIDLNGGTITLQKGASIQGEPGSSITVPDFTVNGSMNLNGGFYLWNGVPLGSAARAAAATTVFLARVASGSGNTYMVDVFGKGSGEDKTATVEATVPQISPDETLPVGTWIGALHKFTNIAENGDVVVTYEFQIPIWLS